MDGSFDIQLIAAEHATSPVLLSIGYNAGHVVVELEGVQAIQRVLAFVAEHRSERGAHWTELGRFASCSVTLYLGSDVIGIIVDSDLAVGTFGQSAGIHIPRELLDEFARALADEHKRFSEHITA